jgi:membrane fusion protein (multidrug efflux system)
VQVGALEGDSWVIQSGLAPGERVILDGLQKAVPGQPVKAVVASATPPAVPPAVPPAAAPPAGAGR